MMNRTNTNAQGEPTSPGQRRGESLNPSTDIISAPIPRKRQREESFQHSDEHDDEPGRQSSQGATELPRTPNAMVSGAEPRLLTFVVDSSKPLGATAEVAEENKGWRLTSVKNGGQAESLGMKVGLYIYSLKGIKLEADDDLMKLLMQAKSASDKYEIVLTDTSSVDEEALPPSPKSTESPSKSPYHTFDFATFSVIPTADGTGTKEYGDLRDDLKKRVRAVCSSLCLFPPDKRPWLDFALNLVFSFLIYEAPTRAITDVERPWLLGVKPMLNGPQPWMATRKFIVRCVKEMLEAEESDWIASTERKQSLMEEKGIPMIKEHLVVWKAALSQPSNADLLKTYAENVWNRFSLDHFSGGSNVEVMHRLTESYSCIVAEKLEARGICPSVPGLSNLSSDQLPIDDASMKALITKYLAKCTEVIPFSKDLDSVAAAVFERFQASFICLQPSHISPSSVRDILDDLEDDSNFISRENEMCIVRVKESALTPIENILFIASDAASSGEDDIFASSKRPTITDNDVEGREAAKSSKGTSVEQGATRAEASADGNASMEEKGRGNEALQEKKTRVYSSVKEVGARCYAEFTNGDYYWGSIVKVTESKKAGKTFDVLFEDGDVLDSIIEKHVFTEIEYMKIFNKDPPEPQVTDRQKRHIDRSGSKDHTTTEKKHRRRLRRRASRSRSDKGSSNKKTDEMVERSTVAVKKMPVVSAEFMDQYTGQQRNNWSPRKLYKMRCKSCALCNKRDCELCSTCLRNASRKNKSLKEVCLRKMCCSIERRRKAQPAVAFSPGWMFYFEEHRKASTLSIKSQPSCPGLHIVSPEGQIFRSVEGAAIHDSSASIDVEAMCQLFRDHIGASHYCIDPHHFLVGKGYCHEWTDAEGRNKVIFGVISRCSREGADVKFTVDYNDNALSFLNSPSNSFECAIQRTQAIDAEIAWGGCIAFERKNEIRRGPGSVVRNIDRTAGCKSWVTPTIRKEEVVEYNGVKLPQLTLVVRGYKLVFSVKESTIPNAGYGVFVKCISLRNDISNTSDHVDDTDSFKLKAGELLDLGIYAPFRAEDEKHTSVFNLKNYVFSMECEEWCFNSLYYDYMYDITDDKTGKVHDSAKLHIPMYVNECGPKDAPTIHADPDPEGSVHYLLGVAYHGDWDDYRDKLKQLDLKVGGDELELFLHYGAKYEAVRVRKGYSTLPEERQREELAGSDEHQAGFVRDIDLYDAKEVAMSVDFFLDRCVPVGAYSKDKPIDGEVRDRALEVARKLRARAQKLQKPQEKESRPATVKDESHGVDLAKTIESSKILIERLMNVNCCRKLPFDTTSGDTNLCDDDMDISSDDAYD